MITRTTSAIVGAVKKVVGGRREERRAPSPQLHQWYVLELGGAHGRGVKSRDSNIIVETVLPGGDLERSLHLLTSLLLPQPCALVTQLRAVGSVFTQVVRADPASRRLLPYPPTSQETSGRFGAPPRWSTPRHAEVWPSPLNLQDCFHRGAEQFGNQKTHTPTPTPTPTPIQHKHTLKSFEAKK